MADRKDLLDRMTERLIAIREEAGDAWPIGIARNTGAVIVADAPDWRGGFWIEILRLLGERTGDWGYYLEGASRLGTLRGLLAHRSILNGPAFYYGAARLYATLSDRNSRTMALAAAYGIRTLADPETGMLPLSDGNDKGKGVTIGIDRALLLDWWALEETGDSTFLEGAERMLHHMIGEYANVENAAPGPILHAMLRALLRGWEAMGEPRFIESAMPLFEQWSAQAGQPGDDLRDAAVMSESLARIAVIDPAPEEAAPFSSAIEPLLARLASAVTPTHDGDNRPAGLLLGPVDEGPDVPIAAQCHLLGALYCLDTEELPC